MSQSLDSIRSAEPHRGHQRAVFVAAAFILLLGAIAGLVMG